MIVYEKCAVIDLLTPSFTMTGTSMQAQKIMGKRKEMNLYQ